MENVNNYDYEADFLKQLEEKRKEIKKPVILVCGYTGTGKSSIIKAIFGDIVPNDRIGDGEPMTQNYENYENDFIKVWDSKGLEPDKGVEDFIIRTEEFIEKRREKRLSLNDHIHIFWYVIQGSGARVTDSDLKIIKIFPPEATIVVISKSDITKSEQFDAMKKRVTDVGIASNRIMPISSDNYNEKISGNNIEELMELTRFIMPEALKVVFEIQKINFEICFDAYKAAFDEAQKVNIERQIKVIEEKKLAATSIIGTATTAVAIPVVGVAIITPVQVTMVASLAALYKLDKEAIKNVAIPFMTGIAANLTKFIPIEEIIIVASVVVKLTGSMGWFLQAQFEKIAITNAKGETPPDLVVDLVAFMEFFKKYKKNISYDYEADFEKQLQEKRKESKKPVILVCGYIGTGKTSLIQAILGDDLVPYNRIGHGPPMTQGYVKYENELVRLWDSKGLEPDSEENVFITRTKGFLKDKYGKENEMADASNLINVFWYVIEGSGARATDDDLKIIAEFPPDSTIVVISKSDITKSEQFDAMKKRITDVGIASNKIIPVSVDNYNEKIAENGITELMELTRSIMPKAYQVAFDEAQKVNAGRHINFFKKRKKWL